LLDIDGVPFVGDMGGMPVEEAVLAREELIEALAQFTPEQREALLLTVAAGLTLEEAARVVGVSHQSIWRRIQRARQEGG
jgi:DNA-directed RNA polymerase specialized sigma24 family protein